MLNKLKSNSNKLLIKIWIGITNFSFKTKFLQKLEIFLYCQWSGFEGNFITIIITL